MRSVLFPSFPLSRPALVLSPQHGKIACVGVCGITSDVCGGLSMPSVEAAGAYKICHDTLPLYLFAQSLFSQELTQEQKVINLIFYIDIWLEKRAVAGFI